MKPVALIMAALVLTGCLDPAGVCDIETRYVAHVRDWNVVCTQGNPTIPSYTASICAVWPAEPPAPEWVGDARAQADSGYPLRAVLVCREMRITDTPIP